MLPFCKVSINELFTGLEYRPMLHVLLLHCMLHATEVSSDFDHLKAAIRTARHHCPIQKNHKLDTSMPELHENITKTRHKECIQLGLQRCWQEVPGSFRQSPSSRHAQAIAQQRFWVSNFSNSSMCSPAQSRYLLSYKLDLEIDLGQLQCSQLWAGDHIPDTWNESFDFRSCLSHT